MIVIVDYCKGNLKSVERGFQAIGAQATITADPDQIACARAIVLPGVGAFADASATMQQNGQLQAIRSSIKAGVPFLGICLGLHLLYEEGLEGREDNDFKKGSSKHTRGLAVLPGVVSALPHLDVGGAKYKIPHVGWNSIEFSEGGNSVPLFKNIPSGECFYFTHSYMAPDTPYTVATTTHSVTFPSVVSYNDTAFGVQFHPEKSSDAGLIILKNFYHIVKAS